LAFVFDASGPTFREELYPDYKANRPAMPEDLRLQIEPLLKIVEAIGVPILREPGIEADDVIGTLATQGHAPGMRVVISTSDKDLTQLVRPGIEWLNTMTGERLDAAWRRGQVRRAPGAHHRLPRADGRCGGQRARRRQVRPKTAAKWLAQYDSLENVIAHAGEIGGKIGENLRAALPRLPLAANWSRSRPTASLPVGPSQLALEAPDIEALRGLYARYGFKQALAGKSAAVRPTSRSGHADADASPWNCLHRRPQSTTSWSPRASAWRHWIGVLEGAPAFAFDTETTSLDCMQARRSSACPSQSSPGRRPMCRWATTIPARRRNCRGSRCWPHSSRCSRTRARARSPSMASTTSTY
jgi:DNA polymerase-1